MQRRPDRRTDGPLDLGEVFERPWVGRAVIERPWWLRWIPFLPTGFEFRTVAVRDGDGVVVNDTQTFPDGRVWERSMRGEEVAPGRWRMSADDMPGGARITVDATGYTFTPYTIRVPLLGPLVVPLRCRDEVRFVDEDTLDDTIAFTFLGLRVGTMTMRLRRT